MAKETEERLIRALEFLKEPHGSTISTIVKAVNGEGPQVSLKKIVQTLRGCLENGILKVSDGRVKLNQVNILADKPKEDKMMMDDRPKGGCLKPACQKKPSCSAKGPAKCFPKKSWKTKGGKHCTKQPTIPISTCDGDPPPGGDGGGGEGGGDSPPCPECPKCKKKKPKPKCPKPKPKCPKPKPKCPKKKKPKCKKPKKKPKKKCAKKVKIQPYCKKKKKCPN